MCLGRRRPARRVTSAADHHHISATASTRPYKAVNVPADKTVSVITTSRIGNEQIFFRHSAAVESRLPAAVKLVSADSLQDSSIFKRLEGLELGSPFHMIAEFSDIPSAHSDQFNLEIPHKNLRDEILLRRYFGIERRS